MKKIMALLLALMMLVLPVAGGAATTDELMTAATQGQATRTSVTFTPGDLSLLLGEYESIYEDVLNTLGLSLYKADDQGSISVSLDDTQVLYAALGLDETMTTYLASNFLGDAPVAVALNEWELLGDKLLELMVATEAMTADEAAAFKANFANAQGNSSAVDAATAFVTVDWTPLLTKAMTLAAKAETSAVTEQPENCNAAATRITLSLTPAEVTDLLDETFACLKADENAMAYLESMNENANTTMAAQMDRFITELRTAADGSDETLEIVCYMNEQGDVVKADIWTTGGLTSIALTYDRLTVAQGEQHQFVFTVKDALDMGLTLCGKYLDAGAAGLIDCTMTMADAEETVSIAVDGVFDDSNVDFSLTMAEVEDDGETDVLMKISAVGKQTDNGFDLKLTADVTAEGSTVAFDLTIVSTKADNDSNLMAKLSMTADGETVDFALTTNHAQTPGDTTASDKGDMTLTIAASGVSMDLLGSYVTTVDTTADAKRTTDVDLSFQIMGMQLKIASLHAVTETCDKEASIASDSAVHLATMSTDELEAWGTGVSQQAQVQLITLIQSLPSSVLNLLLAQ